MKVLIVLSLVAAAYAGIADVYGPMFRPTYSIIAEHLIPMGEKLRVAEERMHKERIVGGTPAVLGQFPYQVATLASYQGIDGTGVCGGSLVSPNRVIYAAHCWHDGINTAFRVTVAAGTIFAFSGGIRLETSDVFLHPSWFPLLVRNDVAVIYLPQSLTFSDVIAPLALPPPSLVGETFNGQIGIASGFGLRSDDDQLTINAGCIDDDQLTINAGLNSVPLSIISNLVCRLSFPLFLVDSNICTSGAAGASTCRGDSGGPLTVNHNGQPILVGITSFGSANGCQAGAPAAFARVTSFLDFFNQHL